MMPLNGGCTAIMLADADYAKRVYLDSTNFQKHSTKNKWMLALGGDNNLAFANGHDWKRQRAVVNPAFYRMDLMAEIFNKKIKQSIEKLAMHCGNAINSAASTKSSASSANNGEQLAQTSADAADFKATDDGCALVMASEMMQRLTLDVVGQSVFGHDFNYIENNTDEALNAYNFVWNNIYLSLFHVLMPFLNYVPTAKVQKMNRSLETIDKLLYSLIDKSKQRADKSKSENLLDLMVDSNTQQDNEANKMTDTELRHNVAAFFIAGHETTATSLSFALYCLAKYPQVQQKLYEEIVQSVGAHGGVTYDSVQNMPYLLSVIKETMRWYPPACQISYRMSQREETFGEYTIPANVSFLN